MSAFRDGGDVGRLSVSDILSQASTCIRDLRTFLGRNQALISSTVFQARDDRGLGGLPPKSTIREDGLSGLRKGVHR